MIVIDTASGTLGGAEKNVVEAARTHAASGGRTVLVEVGKTVVARYGIPETVTLVHIDAKGLESVLLRDWEALLEKHRVQVVMRSKTWVGCASWRLDLAAWRHDSVYLSWEHHPASVEDCEAERRWSGTSLIRRLKRAVRLTVHVRSVNRTVCVSHAVRRPLLSHFGFSPDAVDVIYPGVDFEHFRFDAANRLAARVQWDVPRDAIVLGTMGRLVEYKGNDFVLKLFSELRALRPTLDLYCVIAGTGEDLARLQTLAESLGISERTRFVGWQAHAPTTWSAVDIFPMPSLDEGLGMTLIESIACGSVPIAMTIGGIPEVFSEADSSLLIAPDRPDDWIQRIVQLLDQSPAQREHYQRALYARTRARFDGAVQWSAMMRWIGSQADGA